MKLRGIDFGPVIGASGVNGWFGEGYAYHKLLCFIPGFSMRGITLTAKTFTLLPQKGNMPLSKDGYTPADLKPACIIVKPGAGVVLNAVGLSGPGLPFLLNLKKWQKLENPFFLSFMAVAKTREERMEEMVKVTEILKNALPDFKSKVGLQINFSCPNVGHEQDVLVGEIKEMLAIASVLNIPLVPKLSVQISPEIAEEVLRDSNCDALAISNTIPWRDFPEHARKVFFRSDKSPLERFGGGGVSGKYLLPLVVEWLHLFSRKGVGKPIIAGGGILRPCDVDALVEVGASAVSPGSVVMLRPWNISRITKRAYKLLYKK